MKGSWPWIALALAATALAAAILVGVSALWAQRGREQVQQTIAIRAEAPGLSPEEVESLVTSPIENQVNGMPGVRRIRSASRFGNCSVWLDLEPKAGRSEE